MIGLSKKDSSGDLVKQVPLSPVSAPHSSLSNFTQVIRFRNLKNQARINCNYAEPGTDLDSGAFMEDLESGVLLVDLEPGAMLEDLESGALEEDLEMAWSARLQGSSSRNGRNILCNYLMFSGELEELSGRRSGSSIPSSTEDTKSPCSHPFLSLHD